MNKNKNYMQDLMEIKNLTSKVKKMNEAIMFEDEYDDFEENEQMPQPQEQQIPQEEPEIETGLQDMPEKEEKSAEDAGMEQLDQMGEVDQIREICLKGMIKLNNTPEHPEFQALLKIFTICNKSVEKDNNENK